jgi:hypothetical protein
MGELLSVSAWVMHVSKAESWGAGGFGSNIKLIDMGMCRLETSVRY